MNSFDLTRDFIADYSCLQGWQELLSPPTENSSLYLSRYSVEKIDLADARYLGLAAIDTPGSVRTLDDISISHSSPDSEIMLVERPNNNTQPQLLTDTVKLAATASSRSDQPVPPAPGEVCRLPACKASTGKYAWADQADRANIQVGSFAAVEGNKAKVNGTSHAELRNSPQKYQTTDKGPERKARCLESDGGNRVRAKYASSAKSKPSKAESQARYRTTIKGKLARSVASAKYNTFITALKNGFSNELAREKGEWAAKKRRAQLTKDWLTGPIAE